MEPPVFHKFVVFSELEDETANVIPSIAQCENCGAIHKILEVGLSKQLPKESSPILPDKEEIKSELPSWLSDYLEKYECNIATWQEALFIYKNKIWGNYVILAREREENTVSGKTLLILGEDLHKVESFNAQENLE